VRLAPLARAVLAALCLAAAAGPVHAQTMPDDDAFVREVIETLNSGDVERRRRLIHPAARGCAEALAGAPLEQALRRQAAVQINEDRRWTIRPLNRGQALGSSDKVEWAVRPTHSLQISYQSDARRRRTLIMQLVADEGRWYEVFACPKPGALPPR
jgi:hypothetical protein